MRAARSFLGEYLPYSYGRRSRHPDRSFRTATPALRRVLLSDRPRVPAAERRRHPRVRHLQCETDSGTVCNALIDDGKRRYSVPLRLERHGRWLVAAIQ
jgi:hypothetical protein